jgi:hypothetical protein
MNNIEQENEVIENSLMQGYECDKKKKKKKRKKILVSAQKSIVTSNIKMFLSSSELI